MTVPRTPGSRVRWPRTARNLIGALAGLVLAYALMLAFVYATQRWYVFPAPVGAAPRCPPPCQYLVFDGPGGRRVHTVHLPASAGEPTLVVFHGNGDTLASTLGLVDALAREGLGVYGVEYPGYGPAEAYAPSEAAVYEDAEAAVVRLREHLGVPRERTVLLGHSLGTGVAVEMARRGHAARVILVAPFTSIPDVGARLLPFLPVRWMMEDRFDNLAKARAVTVPTLVIHGGRDGLVPVEMGRRLASALPDARLVVVEDAGHNDALASEPGIGPRELIPFARGLPE
ncbi:MAG: alpha/beta fold hydrolase [Polyangiaceae bacterium]|nr:alpha/beta fold hydrolase [Polyangiaceae bacterium]